LLVFRPFGKWHGLYRRGIFPDPFDPFDDQFRFPKRIGRDPFGLVFYGSVIGPRADDPNLKQTIILVKLNGNSPIAETNLPLMLPSLFGRFLAAIPFLLPRV
jgi:hypothetical protein